jgi:hypothetical protein
VKLPRSEIDVISPQRQQFTAAKTGHQRQDVESLQPLAADHLEQGGALRRRWPGVSGGLSLGRPARRTPGHTPDVTRLRLAHMAGRRDQAQPGSRAEAVCSPAGMDQCAVMTMLSLWLDIPASGPGVQGLPADIPRCGGWRARCARATRLCPSSAVTGTPHGPLLRTAAAAPTPRSARPCRACCSG